MGFSAFVPSDPDRYAGEAKARWGNTEAYRESQKRTAGKSKEELQQSGDAMMEIFAKFGTLRGCDPTCAEAQQLVQELRKFISDHYYSCTDQILAGLGQMYVSDERFKANIDRAGGAGTAELAAQAIAAYCKR